MAPSIPSISRCCFCGNHREVPSSTNCRNWRTAGDTVLIIGAGPTGICTLLCVLLKGPRRVIVCEKDPQRARFVRDHCPDVPVCAPEECAAFTRAHSDHGGADAVLEVAGGKDTFRLAWACARPNAIVTVLALYDEAQTLPLPEM